MNIFPFFIRGATLEKRHGKWWHGEICLQPPHTPLEVEGKKKTFFVQIPSFSVKGLVSEKVTSAAVGVELENNENEEAEKRI